MLWNAVLKPAPNFRLRYCVHIYEEDEHGAMIHFDNENSCTDAAHTVSIRGSETGKEFQACPLSPSTYRCRKENVKKVMTALGGEANKR